MFGVGMSIGAYVWKEPCEETQFFRMANPTNPLPASDEIEVMTCEMLDFYVGRPYGCSLPRFVVDQKNWPHVLTTLLPAEEFDLGHLLQVMAWIKIQHGGEENTIWVYYHDQYPASLIFLFEDEYYRGGSSYGFADVLSVAYADSLRNRPVDSGVIESQLDQGTH